MNYSDTFDTTIMLKKGMNLQLAMVNTCTNHTYETCMITGTELCGYTHTDSQQDQALVGQLTRMQPLLSTDKDFPHLCCHVEVASWHQSSPVCIYTINNF